MLVRPLPAVSRFSLLALLSLACAKGPLSGGAGDYRGVATGITEIGVLEVTVEDSNSGPLPAKGTLKFPSKSIDLTGSLDKSKTQLSLSSSDGYKVVGESRPGLAYGSYTNAAGTDLGSFGLLLQTTGSVELFCGSFDDTSTNVTKGVTLPLAIAGIPGEGAVCVGPNFAWLGGLGKDDSLSCTDAGGNLMEGKINEGSANKWGTGQHYGTWNVTPCADKGSSNADGGVPDASVATDAN